MSCITGIGANVYDTLITIPRYPAEDTKMRAGRVLECGGGPVGTGLVAAARLGADAAYIGALAEDTGGRFLRTDMAKRGMRTDLIQADPCAQSFASWIWLSEEGGSRTCVFNKENLPVWELNEGQAKAISEAELLMVDGNELKNAIAAATLARQSGTRVLYDAGGRYEGIEPLLSLADILVPSEEFALAHTGETDAAAAAKKLYETYSAEAVIITQGVKGGIYYNGETVTAYPAFPVTVVDSNGAGDVFHGALAFALTLGYDYYKACIFSSAVSALKCTRLGARDGVPTLGETLTFLKERGFDEFEEELE